MPSPYRERLRAAASSLGMSVHQYERARAAGTAPGVRSVLGASPRAGGAPAGRRRDYSGRRAAENALARARGYRSKDDQAKRRREGRPAPNDPAWGRRRSRAGDFYRVGITSNDRPVGADLRRLLDAADRAPSGTRAHVLAIYDDGNVSTLSPPGGWDAQVAAAIIASFGSGDATIPDFVAAVGDRKYGSADLTGADTAEIEELQVRLYEPGGGA